MIWEDFSSVKAVAVKVWHLLQVTLALTGFPQHLPSLLDYAFPSTRGRPGPHSGGSLCTVLEPSLLRWGERQEVSSQWSDTFIHLSKGSKEGSPLLKQMLDPGLYLQYLD